MVARNQDKINAGGYGIRQAKLYLYLSHLEVFLQLSMLISFDNYGINPFYALTWFAYPMY